jgi:hypothetical protein
VTRRFTTYSALSAAAALAVRLIALSAQPSAHLDSNNAQGAHAPEPPDGCRLRRRSGCSSQSYPIKIASLLLFFALGTSSLLHAQEFDLSNGHLPILSLDNQ